MRKKIIKATEAARSFSALINRVRYHGEQFEIQRGREIVACLVPPGPATELPIADLNQVWAELPRLDEEDAQAFTEEIQALRRRMRPPGDAWD